MQIALIKLGSFSHINAHVLHQLERTFPEYSVEVFDVKKLMRPRTATLMLNLPFLLAQYGRDLVAGKKRWRDAMMITSFMFDQIAHELNKIIHPKQYAFTFQTQSLFNARIASIPHFVYTDHTVLANKRYPVVDLQQAMYARAWLKREKTIYHHADYVFTASNFARESIIQDYAGDPEQVVCVYTGVNIDVPVQASAKTYAPEILFVGVEWERKGGPQLLAAFEQVLHQRPDARLTIIGCEPTVDLPQVQVVGRIAPTALAPYFERAGVFCLPAWIEPAGIAYSEAAWYQLPVVATTIGGIPDRVLDQETGFLVEPGDISGLTERLLQVLNDPALAARLGQAGRERAEQLFDWDKVGERMAATIRSTGLQGLAI